jgi:hypothetical protein
MSGKEMHEWIEEENKKRISKIKKEDWIRMKEKCTGKREKRD